MNRAAFVFYVEQRRFKAHPFALFASQLYVGKELHLLDLDTVAFASLATTARHIEAEVRRVKAMRLSFASRSEQIANAVVDFDVSDRVRARRATDWRLIYQHYVTYIKVYDG